MLCDREVAGKRNNVISMELHLYAGMLQAQEEARSPGGGCPLVEREVPSLPPSAAAEGGNQRHFNGQ